MGLLIGGLVTAVIALAVALVISLGGDDDSDSGSGSTTATETTGAAADLAISVTSDGVQSLGDFKPQVEGVTGATETFGEATGTRQDSPDVCFVNWAPLGMEITFANFGAEDACAPEAGKVASITIRNTGEETARWVTAEGLRLGDSLDRLQELYPGAHELPGNEVPATGLEPGETGYSLFDMPTPIGDLGSISTLTAAISTDQVAGFLMHIGAAGE